MEIPESLWTPAQEPCVVLRSSNMNGRCITLASLPSQSTAGMVVDRFSAYHQASLLLLLYSNMSSPPHTTSTLCPKPQRVAVAPDVACQVCVHRPGKVRSKPDVITYLLSSGGQSDACRIVDAPSLRVIHSRCAPCALLTARQMDAWCAPLRCRGNGGGKWDEV